MNANRERIAYIAKGAVIAALYAALCIVLQSISFGPIQVRVANALMIMPFYTTAAIPGLFIGCIIANAVGGGILIDVIAGSLVTLGGAVGARLLRKRPWLMPLPTVILNILIVPLILKYGYGVPLPLYLSMIYIAVGAVIACYGLGMPLYYALKPAEPFLVDDFELPWENEKSR